MDKKRSMVNGADSHMMKRRVDHLDTFHIQLNARRVQGTKFVNENCTDFAFVGANVWQLVEAEAGIFNEQVNGTNPAEYLFQTAAANNITVIRMFAEGIFLDFKVLS